MSSVGRKMLNDVILKPAEPKDPVSFALLPSPFSLQRLRTA